MACCATPGGCGRRDLLTGGPGLVKQRSTGLFACYLCVALPVLFPIQPKVHIDPPRRSEEGNPERDGLFDILSGKSHDPTWERRHRVGPNR